MGCNVDENDKVSFMDSVHFPSEETTNGEDLKAMTQSLYFEFVEKLISKLTGDGIAKWELPA